jgi:hypothetical protein
MALILSVPSILVLGSGWCYALLDRGQGIHDRPQLVDTAKIIPSAEISCKIGGSRYSLVRFLGLVTKRRTSFITRCDVKKKLSSRLQPKFACLASPYSKVSDALSSSDLPRSSSGPRGQLRRIEALLILLLSLLVIQKLKHTRCIATQ